MGAGRRRARGRRWRWRSRGARTRRQWTCRCVRRAARALRRAHRTRRSAHACGRSGRAPSRRAVARVRSAVSRGSGPCDRAGRGGAERRRTVARKHQRRSADWPRHPMPRAVRRPARVAFGRRFPHRPFEAPDKVTETLVVAEDDSGGGPGRRGERCGRVDGSRIAAMVRIAVVASSDVSTPERTRSQSSIPLSAAGSG